MILDLLSVTELLRQVWNIDSFPKSLYEKVNHAIEWYSSIIDPISGNAPNMGGNDGTYLFNYDQKEYRDFRPTLLLASALFNKPIPENFVTSHSLIEMFKTPINHVEKKSPSSKIFSQGGYLKLVRKDGMAILRAPKYLFRPSHSDALHIDIWQDGLNMNDEIVIQKVLKNLNVNPKTFALRSTSSSIKDSLRKKTSEAFSKGIFGAPTFVVNNKIFWGQDRIEFALKEASK